MDRFLDPYLYHLKSGQMHGNGQFANARLKTVRSDLFPTIDELLHNNQKYASL